MSELGALLFYCEELRFALCGTSRQEEDKWCQVCMWNSVLYSSPEPPEHLRPVAIELAALTKVLQQGIQRLLPWANGMVEDAEIAFYRRWYEEINASYLRQDKPEVFAPSLVTALQSEAQAVWRDVVAFTPDTPQHTLLECLQESMVQAQCALARTRRVLLNKGSDAQWQAAGEYRKALIHMASEDALRLVLKAKRDGLDLADPQHYLRVFAQALARKCVADQRLLHQELPTATCLTPGVPLTV
jgi:hypothetical protein